MLSLLVSLGEVLRRSGRVKAMCFFSRLVELHGTFAEVGAADDLTGNSNRNDVSFYYCEECEDVVEEVEEKDEEEDDRLCLCCCCCYLMRRGLNLFLV